MFPRSLIRLTSLTVVTAFLCVLLAALRVGAETSFHEPRHRPTSGLEEEALFSIWKVTQHEPVYADPFQIPYAISYFNWLFYASYGLAGTLALNFFQLDSAWLPTVTRFFSLLLTIGCGFAFYHAAREGRLWPEQWTRLQRVAFATIAVFNPLFGFFSFTTRPDAGALLFELVGLALVHRYLRTQSSRLLAVATLVFYCAWSFKQSTVLVVGGICLWFLFQRRFSDFLLVSGLSAGLYLLTFWIGGPKYFYALVQSQANCAFHFSLGAENFVRACMKTPFFPLALGVMGFSCPSKNENGSGPVRTPIPTVFLFSLVGSAAMSMKVGASDYYFLAPCLLGMLWLLGWWARRDTAAFPKRVLLAGLSLQFLCVGVVLTGHAGVITDTAEQQRHRQLALRLDSLPGPILVGERFGNLPWIQRKPPHFVYAYTYYVDRVAGKTYAHGGLAGLIQSHQLNTIVLRNSGPPPATPIFDGQTLTDYELLRSEAGYDFYVLPKELASP